MIQINPPTTPIAPSGTIKRIKETNNRVADSKQLRDSPKKPFVERRKQKDRRKQQRKGQFLESRSGIDRRRGKQPTIPSIDTTV